MKMMKDLSKLPKQDVIKFFNSIDTVLSDCDGVLWKTDSVIEGSSSVINRFRELGKRIMFVSNISSKIREGVVEKCQKFDIVCKKEEVLCSSYLVAHYLQRIGFNKKVYVIGLPTILQELDFVGIKHAQLDSEMGPTTLYGIAQNFKYDPEIGAIVVSFDSAFSYAKMFQAANYLNDPQCLFVVSYAEDQLPNSLNMVMPGPGGIVKAIQTASKREPFLIGKPSQYLAKMLVEEYRIKPDRTLMIGDNCETDILLGSRGGFKTLLVLTGVTSFDQVNNYNNSKNPYSQDLVPDFYTEKLGDLLDYLK